jgi:hypothetical protein
MCANPEPQHAILNFRRHCPIVEPDARRPDVTEPFEMKRRMFRIDFQKLVALVSQLLDVVREFR